MSGEEVAKEGLAVEVPELELGFSTNDPLLSLGDLVAPSITEEYTRDDEGHIPGVMEIVQKVAGNRELLPVYIRGGHFSTDKILRFLNESGAGLEILTDPTGKRVSYPYMLGPNWLVWFVNYFMGYTVVSTESADTWVPVAEIHCPDLEGCSADFVCSTTRNNQYSFKVTALGFSGGSGYSKKIRLSTGATAEKKSLQLQVKAEITKRIYQNDLGDRIFALDISKIFDETRYVAIDVSEFYRIPIQSIMQDENLRAISFDNKVDKPFQILEVETGKKHNFSWGTKLSGLLAGSTAALSVESQLLSNASFRYNFRPGYRYVYYPVQLNSHVYFVFYEQGG